MIAITDFLSSVIRVIFEFLHLGYSITEAPERDPTLRAEFEKDQQILSIYHEGFCVDGKRSLSLKDSFRHMVIVGRSGIGKSTSTFIPSLLTMHTSGSSLIIHDPSEELFKLTAGHLKQQGYQVSILNFGNPNRSVGFNPLDKIKRPSDIDKLASMLVNTSLKKSDPFWDNSGIQLVKIGIHLVLKLPLQYRNLANVLHIIKLLGANPKRMDELISQYADDKLFIDYKAFLANDSKVQSGIIATACAALNIFSDEQVALTTSMDTIDFKTFRKKKTALFIQNKISDQQYLNTLISIWFETLFASLMEDVPKQNDKSVYILLDEAASGLKMPSLSNAISHFRKYKVGCVLGLQSIEQLKETYGNNDTTTILSNCYLQMYFSEQSHATSKMLEEMLGKYHYNDERGNTNLIRNLMESNEIRMMNNTNAIIIAGNEKPILAHLTPYYERWWLKLRANQKQPPLVGVGILNNVTYIQ
jgi:type IV secretion system protein VirD4